MFLNSEHISGQWINNLIYVNYSLNLYLLLFFQLNGRSTLPGQPSSDAASA